MPNTTAIVVADAHLGSTPGDRSAFQRFLAAVPDLGDHLVVNGDLFEFWFEYRAVIPRLAFPVLRALHDLVRAGIRLTVMGGNHDRWGGPFWEEEIGAQFHPEGARLALAGFMADVRHGDGLVEIHMASRVLHRVTRWRPTVAAFRWVHPDVALGMVERLSGRLARGTRDPLVLDRAAASQARWARDQLAAEPNLDLVVLAHTHRAMLETVGPQRWYLNPGAWCEGRRYALVTAEGPALRAF